MAIDALAELKFPLLTRLATTTKAIAPEKLDQLLDNCPSLTSLRLELVAMNPYFLQLKERPRLYRLLTEAHVHEDDEAPSMKVDAAASLLAPCTRLRNLEHDLTDHGGLASFLPPTIITQLKCLSFKDVPRALVTMQSFSRCNVERLTIAQDTRAIVGLPSPALSCVTNNIDALHCSMPYLTSFYLSDRTTEPGVLIAMTRRVMQLATVLRSLYLSMPPLLSDTDKAPLRELVQHAEQRALESMVVEARGASDIVGPIRKSLYWTRVKTHL